MYNEMIQKLKYLNNEIHNLKQAKKAASDIKFYTFTVSGGNYYTWLITYEDGSQPIITEVFSGIDTTLSAPNNNTQYIFGYSQYITDMTILSTRKIISVEGIA